MLRNLGRIFFNSDIETSCLFGSICSNGTLYAPFARNIDRQ